VASADEQALRDQFVRLKFTPNVGIVLGEQAGGEYLIAVDVDDAERLAQLESELGELPPTLTGKSARGDRRFYRAPSDLRNVTGVGGNGEKHGHTPGVDVKAKGGQVVVAPSRHASGAIYAWSYPLAPIADLPPGWVLALRPAPKVPQEFHEYTPTTLREDKRALKRAEKYLQAAVIAETSQLSLTREGSRNVALHRALCRLLPLAHGLSLATGHGYVVRECSNAARAAGLHDREITTTIASAEKWLQDSGAARMPHVLSVNGKPAEEETSPESPTPDEAPPVKLLEDNGAPAKIAENVARMLPFYPRGAPRYDAFSDRILWPDGLEVTDDDELDVQGWLMSRPASSRVRVGPEVVHGGILLHAKRNPFDALHEFLRALPEWDETPRLDTWLVEIAKCKDIPAVRLFGRKWLIQAMARGTDPGIEADGVLVLEGPQGAGKNRLIKALFGDFHRSLACYDPGDVEAARIAGSCWVVHDDEFGGSRADVDRLKAFVSTTADTYRPPYGRNLVTRARRAVIIASTNQSTYLTDETNRRFYPVTVGEIDVERARAERDQLFAEALRARVSGEPWWIAASDPIAFEAQDERRARDVIEESVAAFVLGRTKPLTTIELADAVGIAPEKRDRALEMRLGRALRLEGWKRERVMVGGIRRYLYTPPAAPPAATLSS
jgi:putative DNA primase/helicase